MRLAPSLLACEKLEPNPRRWFRLQPAEERRVRCLACTVNFLAQQVYDRMLKGERPSPTFFSQTTIRGYGDEALARYFHPIPCGRGRVGPDESFSRKLATMVTTGTVDEALSTIRSASRYLVMSQVLRALYRPRGIREVETLIPFQFRLRGSIDLAVHVRRGDRLTVERQAERIKAWEVDELVQLVRTNLGHSNGTILVASDDNHFCGEVVGKLREYGHTALTMANDKERLDDQNRSLEAAAVCDASCIPPLIALIEAYKHASTLLLSTRSNIGSHLLASWAAANADAVPKLVDLDAGLKSSIRAGPGGRFFCDLAWGSRRGMCKVSETTCDLPSMTKRSFCSAKEGVGRS
jgi:hypothetical protein